MRHDLLLRRIGRHHRHRHVVGFVARTAPHRVRRFDARRGLGRRGSDRRGDRRHRRRGRRRHDRRRYRRRGQRRRRRRRGRRADRARSPDAPAPAAPTPPPSCASAPAKTPTDAPMVAATNTPIHTARLAHGLCCARIAAILPVDDNFEWPLVGVIGPCAARPAASALASRPARARRVTRRRPVHHDWRQPLALGPTRLRLDAIERRDHLLRVVGPAIARLLRAAPGSDLSSACGMFASIDARLGGSSRRCLQHHLHRLRAFERQHARRQPEQDDAERIDVDALIDVAARRLLRRDVVRRAEDRSVARQSSTRSASVLSSLAMPKSSTLTRSRRARAIGDEDVRRLEVAMDDAERVRLRQRRRDLSREADRARAAAAAPAPRRSPRATRRRRTPSRGTARRRRSRRPCAR